MFVFMGIIVNSYFIMPYVGLIFDKTMPVLELPSFMWDIIKLSVSAYVVGRSVEKGITNWKEGGTN
jgi:hypothetical protein